MNKKITCGVIIGLFVMILASACSGGEKVITNTSAQKQVEPQQQKSIATKLEMYTVGNGKIGLFHKNLTVDEAKKLITGTYGGRFGEAQEPGGEGTKVPVINAYINTATDTPPFLKITLDTEGKIYRIEALSPEFKTAKGLHVGSTWSDIRSAYPQAKVSSENIIAFLIPDDKVTCRLTTKAKVDWQKVRSGQESPPEDLKIVGMFTY